MKPFKTLLFSLLHIFRHQHQIYRQFSIFSGLWFLGFKYLNMYFNLRSSAFTPETLDRRKVVVWWPHIDVRLEDRMASGLQILYKYLKKKRCQCSAQYVYTLTHLYSHTHSHATSPVMSEQWHVTPGLVLEVLRRCRSRRRCAAPPPLTPRMSY